MNKSIVLMPNWIGDIILALTVIYCKDSKDNEKLTLLVPEPFVDLCKLLTKMPIISFPYKNRKKYRNSLKTIRGEHFDAIYLLPYSFSSGWFAFRTGIPRRRGVKKDGRGVFLSDALPVSTRDYSRHILHEYSEILETGFVAPEKWEGYEISLDSEYKNSIVFCPGADYGPSKQWTGYSKLAQMMPEKNIIILGGNNDINIGKQIVESAKGDITDLTGKTTLPQAATILASAQCVISNDSGLMHIAGYLGTSVIGIFGSTDPAWTSPVGTDSIILYKNEQCSPCFKRTCKWGHYNCLNRISPEDVFKAINKQVAK